jgi:D-beta-D-heptose 7-phosphate kinase / D-beta-D-heptose 1-phosphate adenosyltransferase
MMRRFNEIVHEFDGTIAVVGDVILDAFVFGDVERVSPEAPVPVIRITGQEWMPGGAGNVARGIARLGGRALLAGVIGLDQEGQLLAELLDDEERLQLNLVEDATNLTSLKTRYVSSGQQLLRADREPYALRYEAEAQLNAAISSFSGIRAVVCSDYSKGAITPAVFASILDAARVNEALIIVDPKRRDLAFYTGASIITPNAREAEAATDIDCCSEDGAAAAARAIAEQTHCNTVIITRGFKGITVLCRDDPECLVHLPARACEVYNVAGAGDTFVATLSVGLAAGAAMEEACHFANMAAGLSVSKITTTAVSRDELVRASEESDLITEHEKVTSEAESVARVRTWRARGDRIVFTNGCFDLLHPGHLSLLRHAKAQGDRLIVGLNSDASVRRLKGEGRPLQTETARAMVLAAVEGVDVVVIFSEDTPIPLIEALRPDVLVKGSDYREDEVLGGSFVRSRGGRVVLAPTVEGYSTSRTIERLRVAGVHRPSQVREAAVRG